MQQRYYDPTAGRFLSVDPIVTDANTGKGFGLYTYVDNNPYAKIDPDGREPKMGECGWAKMQCEVIGGSSSAGSGGDSKAQGSSSTAAAGAGALTITATGDAVASGTSAASAGAGSWVFRLFGAAGLALVPSSLGDGTLAAGPAFNIQKSDSRELGDNLVKVGASRAPDAHAHHIVAAADSRATPARLVLAAAGMNINDPHNGIFLNSSAHQRIHTDVYYRAVNAALTGAVGYKDVALRLNMIYGAIQAGTFPR